MTLVLVTIRVLYQLELEQIGSGKALSLLPGPSQHEVDPFEEPSSADITLHLAASYMIDTASECTAEFLCQEIAFLLSP